MLHYTVRAAILNAVTAAAPGFRGRVLDVGCGSMPYREVLAAHGKVTEYIGLDIEANEKYGVFPHLLWDGNVIPLANAAVDNILTTEFLEHHPDPQAVLREMHRVLAAGGSIFGTVPFIWNLHELPNDEFRYTPMSLERMLSAAGFTDIKIEALGGWNYSLAQMLGLWITFAPLGRLTRAILKRVLYPFYRWLIATDVRPQIFDGGENSMFSALSFRCRKP